MKAVHIETERLVLKALSLSHLSQDYVDWLNDPEVNKFLESGGDYSLEKLEEYLTQVESHDILFWAIHLKQDDLHIGNIKIDPVYHKHGRAEYGIMMGRKSEWGKGYAKEASLAVLKFCFEELNIRKITLGVVADNENAVNLYKKMGFITEGTFKDHAMYLGKYCDTYRMAIFNPEFVSDEK